MKNRIKNLLLILSKINAMIRENPVLPRNNAIGEYRLIPINPH